MAAVEKYDLMSQVVLMVIFDTPIPEQYWIDVIAVEIPSE